MSLDFIIFFLYYFLILFSVIGYGYFLLSFEKKRLENLTFGHIGLIGIFFLIIYSYVSHLLIPHSKIHNLIVIIVGNTFFLYFVGKIYKKDFIKKNFYILITIFLILTISLFVEKNHDDFPYYHFQYTYYLTQESLNFGIGNFNHGFRTPSSIFYLNSLFYLPLVDYYLFNFSAVYILGFSNIILFHQIFKFKRKKKEFFNNQFTLYLSILVFIFINIFFYRISEHGTDRSAQILILVLFIFLLSYIQNPQSLKKTDLLFLYVLVGLIISLKSFYFLYLILIIPFYFLIFEKKKTIFSTFNFIFFNRYMFYLLILMCFVIISYFTNTGCLIYPVSFTCFDNFEWSILKNDVIIMNNWYELWSKSGANPNSRVEDPEIYIKGFNWINNWIENYFFNKVSDFLLGLFIIVLVMFLVYSKSSKVKPYEKNKKILYLTYIILLILLVEWLYNHPALRYGGYCIFALIVFIPLSLYLSKHNITFNKFYKSTSILLAITILIFVTRNFARISAEIQLYEYKPFSKTFYTIDDEYFGIQKKIEKIKNKKGMFNKSIF